MACFAGLCLHGCCAPKADEVKAKVDKNAYRIIDSKWKDQFGVKANYRIDSAGPAPFDIQDTNAYLSGSTLSLAQAVNYAVDHNLIYQLEKDFLYIKALDLRLARHQFDYLPFGSAETGYVKNGEDEGLTAGGGIGVNKLFKTGAKISLGLATAWMEVLSGDKDSGLSNVFLAVFEQPLMRGRDPNIVLENLTQSERDVLYQIRFFSRFRKRFAVSITSRYYEVLQAYDAYRNARDNFQSLIDIYDHAYKLSIAGRLPQFELDQARQDKLIASDSYLQAEKFYNQQLDDFKLALGMPVELEIQLDYNELAALRNIEMKMPAFSENEAVGTALDRRLDLANTFDAVIDAERKVLVAYDDMRPDLRIAIASEMQSNRAITPFSSGKDKAFIGLRFDPNLDPLSQENNYRLSLVFLEQNQRSYKEKLNSVILDVRTVYRDLMESAQRYKVQSEQLVLARHRLKDTMNLLQYARANTRDVLDAQRDLFRAQDAATEAMVIYTISMLRFYRDVEIMEVRPDGMWENIFAVNSDTIKKER